jgi:hypothetical protein
MESIQPHRPHTLISGWFDVADGAVADVEDITRLGLDCDEQPSEGFGVGFSDGIGDRDDGGEVRGDAERCEFLLGEWTVAQQAELGVRGQETQGWQDVLVQLNAEPLGEPRRHVGSARFRVGEHAAPEGQRLNPQTPVLSVDGAIISTDPRFPANDVTQYLGHFVTSDRHRRAANRRPPIGEGVVQVEDHDPPVHGEMIAHRSAAPNSTGSNWS